MSDFVVVALSVGTPDRTKTDKALSFRFLMGVASPASLADIAVCSVKPARPLVFLLYHLLLLVFCFVSFLLLFLMQGECFSRQANGSSV